MVDPGTGGVEVLDYCVVDDVGRIINPETLHGQVIGAAVQGLGSTFTEEVAYDSNGQILVGSLAEYMVPLATDYPVVRAVSLEAHPSPNNPLGARALYLGATEYRIHGTAQPWTIGQAVSSGCIRLTNEDVMDLYKRAKVGATVIVR